MTDTLLLLSGLDPSVVRQWVAGTLIAGAVSLWLLAIAQWNRRRNDRHALAAVELNGRPS